MSTVPPIRREVLVDADPATAFEVFTRHVEVTFAPAGAQALVAQTLVALTHEGWHAVVDPAAARAEYEQGWSLVLGRYRDHADQRVGFQNSAMVLTWASTRPARIRLGGRRERAGA